MIIEAKKLAAKKSTIKMKFAYKIIFKKERKKFDFATLSSKISR